MGPEQGLFIDYCPLFKGAFSVFMLVFRSAFGELLNSFPRPPECTSVKGLMVDGIWGLLKGSWGVLVASCMSGHQGHWLRAQGGHLELWLCQTPSFQVGSSGEKAHDGSQWGFDEKLWELGCLVWLCECSYWQMI